LKPYHAEWWFGCGVHYFAVLRREGENPCDGEAALAVMQLMEKIEANVCV
jgi:hypothetical protein